MRVNGGVGIEGSEKGGGNERAVVFIRWEVEWGERWMGRGRGLGFRNIWWGFEVGNRYNQKNVGEKLGLLSLSSGLSRICI